MKVLTTKLATKNKSVQFGTRDAQKRILILGFPNAVPREPVQRGSATVMPENPLDTPCNKCGGNLGTHPNVQSSF